MNSSVLHTFNFLTDKRIDYFSIQNEEIISLLRNLNPNNPNKTSGSVGISTPWYFLFNLLQHANLIIRINYDVSQCYEFSHVKSRAVRQ